jgi:hypothetical protein
MRPVTAVLALLLLTTGCADDERIEVQGSGSVITETRVVAQFDEISIAGFGEVTLEVGPGPSLIVEAEDNVMPHLVTDVAGGTLEITSKENVSFQNVLEPRYTVTIPSLTAVSIAGSGGVTASGLGGESFEVSISGSGDVIPSGSVASLAVTISGSGTFLGDDLIVEDAEVSISGSGTIVVHAVTTLDASIAGSGTIAYLGDPVLTQSVSGSGTIIGG